MPYHDIGYIRMKRRVKALGVACLERTSSDVSKSRSLTTVRQNWATGFGMTIAQPW